MAARRYRALLSLLLPAALAFVACRLDSRRGVLLVTLDAVRADHLSCYGYPVKATPYIDGLAARGATFEQAVAVSSNTPISHAAILTGLYPQRNGVRFIHGFQAHRLADGVPTTAGVFAGAGYSTAVFVSAFPLIATRYGPDRGFGLYDDGVVSDARAAMSDEGFVAIKENQRKGEETIGRFLAWMRKEKPEGASRTWNRGHFRPPAARGTRERQSRPNRRLLVFPDATADSADFGADYAHGQRPQRYFTVHPRSARPRGSICEITECWPELQGSRRGESSVVMAEPVSGLTFVIAQPELRPLRASHFDLSKTRLLDSPFLKGVP